MRIWNTRLAVALFTAAIIGFGALSAEAASGYRKGTQFNSPMDQQQLTPEQLEKARQIFDDNYEQMDEARHILNSKRAELDRELNSPNPDSGRIASLSQEIGILRGQMLAARAQARNQLARQGLPPDCFGPCWGGRGCGMMYNGQGYNGWHHGNYRRHHGHRSDWGNWR